MADSVSDKVEAWLVEQLQSRLPLTFLPSKGDTDIEAPFGVVVISKSEEMIADIDLYTCTGGIVFISHTDDATSQEHKDKVESIRIALKEIRGLEGEFDEGRALHVHGFDFGGMKSNDSEEESAHADTFPITLGVTG